jgi:hypothetical protein
MKQFIRFECDKYLQQGTVEPADAVIPAWGMTLEKLQHAGWDVINSAIQTGSCPHEGQKFIFLLEREAP